MKSVFNNAYVLLTLATLLWGGNSVAGKLASFDWQPFTITSARWLLTALLLLPFAWPHLKRDWQILTTDWKTLAALGAFGMACLLYTSPSPRDKRQSRMPSSA